MLMHSAEAFMAYCAISFTLMVMAPSGFFFAAAFHAATYDNAIMVAIAFMAAEIMVKYHELH